MSDVLNKSVMVGLSAVGGLALGGKEALRQRRSGEAPPGSPFELNAIARHAALGAVAGAAIGFIVQMNFWKGGTESLLDKMRGRRVPARTPPTASGRSSFLPSLRRGRGGSTRMTGTDRVIARANNRVSIREGISDLFDRARTSVSNAGRDVMERWRNTEFRSWGERWSAFRRNGMRLNLDEPIHLFRDVHGAALDRPDHFQLAALIEQFSSVESQAEWQGMLRKLERNGVGPDGGAFTQTFMDRLSTFLSRRAGWVESRGNGLQALVSNDPIPKIVEKFASRNVVT